MERPVIFVSHIHEERSLALSLKTAIETEFSGLIDIFVSSDGESIPAGANFLSHIETALQKCTAFICLVSPKSVNRNWINFELGAVWLRSISQISPSINLPVIPVCYGGITPAKLPQPINNFNGIVGNNADELKFLFQTLQDTLNGRGNLRTDFHQLASIFDSYSRKVSSKQAIEEIFSIITSYFHNDQKITFSDIKQRLAENSSIPGFLVHINAISTIHLQRLHELSESLPKGYISIEVKESVIQATTMGANTGANITITLDRHAILQA